LETEVKIGNKYGSWLVQEGPTRGKKYYCVCLSCGKTAKYVKGYDLLNGRTTTCKSCATKLRRETHGMSNSLEYNTWVHLNQRCYNPKNKDYKNYGARGIEVYPLWRTSFESFYMMVGPRPNPTDTIERIDYNKGYFPGNVKWASRQDQVLNKCFHPETPLLLHSGGVKLVKDIVVGDKLMGPDSLPRTVQEVTTGYGELYSIEQKRGMPYVANGSHVLVLRNRHSETEIECSVDDYLNRFKSFKYDHQQFSVEVHYPERYTPLDPYLFGLWLGDGRKATTCFRIITMDQEIVEFLSSFAVSNNLKLSKYEKLGKCNEWGLVKTSGRTNPLLAPLRESVKSWDSYMFNSTENRLKFLAGIMDSDGYWSDDHHHYILNWKHKEWIHKVYLLARSLGFASSPPRSRNKGQYYQLLISRVSVAGAPPCLVPHKKPRTYSKYRSLRSPINITSVGIDKFYGITVGEDNRFLLEDCTVVHNSDNIYLEIGGVSKTVSQWAEEAPVSGFTIYKRINRGWLEKYGAYKTVFTPSAASLGTAASLGSNTTQDDEEAEEDDPS
jgi:hypothetical protein